MSKEIEKKNKLDLWIGGVMATLVFVGIPLLYVWNYKLENRLTSTDELGYQVRKNNDDIRALKEIIYKEEIEKAQEIMKNAGYSILGWTFLEKRYDGLVFEYRDFHWSVPVKCLLVDVEKRIIIDKPADKEGCEYVF